MTRMLSAAAALAVLSTPGMRAQGIDVAGMLDSYDQGRYDEAVAKAAALPDLGPFRLRFVQDTPQWINAEPLRRDARSAAAAAFLLELTAMRLESDWGRLADLIEYTCVQLRTTGPPTPFERAWHAASHALAAGLARACGCSANTRACRINSRPPPRRRIRSVRRRGI